MVAHRGGHNVPHKVNLTGGEGDLSNSLTHVFHIDVIVQKMEPRLRLQNAQAQVY
jgi:hypothetical protein